MPNRAYTVRPSLGSALVGLLVFFLVVWLLFKVAAFAFKALLFAGPVLLVAAFFIDRPTVTGFFRWLGDVWRATPLNGLVYTAVAVLAYPITCAYLFGKALVKRTVRRKLGDLEARVREQARAGFPGATAGPRGLGDEGGAYETVVRDGVEIRIPKGGVG